MIRDQDQDSPVTELSIQTRVQSRADLAFRKEPSRGRISVCIDHCQAPGHARMPGIQDLTFYFWNNTANILHVLPVLLAE